MVGKTERDKVPETQGQEDSRFAQELLTREVDGPQRPEISGYHSSSAEPSSPHAQLCICERLLKSHSE